MARCRARRRSVPAGDRLGECGDLYPLVGKESLADVGAVAERGRNDDGFPMTATASPLTLAPWLASLRAYDRPNHALAIGTYTADFGRIHAGWTP
jgi:hypothetical protein